MDPVVTTQEFSACKWLFAKCLIYKPKDHLLIYVFHFIIRLAKNLAWLTISVNDVDVWSIDFQEMTNAFAIYWINQQVSTCTSLYSLV